MRDEAQLAKALREAASLAAREPDSVFLLGVEPGEWRYLTGKEVRDLFAYVEEKEREAERSPKPHRAVDKAHRGERKGPRQPKPEWKKPPKRPRPAGPPGTGKPGRRRAPDRKKPRNNFV